jgi:hypothetical protein
MKGARGDRWLLSTMGGRIRASSHGIELQAFDRGHRQFAITIHKPSLAGGLQELSEGNYVCQA